MDQQAYVPSSYRSLAPVNDIKGPSVHNSPKNFAASVDSAPLDSTRLCRSTTLPNRTEKRRFEKMPTKPTFEQAQLHLQVYEQRREERLRKARDWFFQNYWPQSFEE